MKTTWELWPWETMLDSAEAEKQAGMDARHFPVRESLEPLPYYGSFSAYGDHVRKCGVCRSSTLFGCADGEALMDDARTGMGEQTRLALSN